jgi:dihydrofolate reductase
MDEAQRLVLGPHTIQEFAEMLAGITEDSAADDPVNTRMKYLPTTVISATLRGPLDWPDATIVSGDAVDVVARLKDESDAPIISHGSVSLNWSLMAAGLVDRIRVTIFPVISGRTGVEPIFGGAGDFDLELVEARTLDGRTQELTYRPHVH